MTGSFRLPFLYGITDPRGARRLSPIAAARLLVSAGVLLIQVRDKTKAAGTRFSAMSDAVFFVKESGGRAIVNDRCDLALLAGADGVHLGEEDLPPEAALRVLSSGAVVGWSTHSAESALSAMEKPGVTYVALGPIFETKSKESSVSPLGLRAIEEAAKRKLKPLVVIGGITPERVGECLAAGADSVAMIAGLLDGDPARNVAISMERFTRAGFRSSS